MRLLDLKQGSVDHVAKLKIVFAPTGNAAVEHLLKGGEHAVVAAAHALQQVGDFPAENPVCLLH